MMVRLMEKGAADMCNLSDGIERQGFAKGLAEARSKNVINRLRRYIRRQIPITDDVIADIAEDNEITIEKVYFIAKENDISLS